MRELRAGKGDSFINREDVTSALDKYLGDISKTPLLTPGEEIDLAKKIKQGDKIALEKLVKANLRFVVNVAKQYRGRGLSLEDLISEGNIGLIKAAESFDETKGFKFISFAVTVIRRKINEAVIEKARLIRKPSSVNVGFSKLSEIKLKKEQELGQELSVEELAGLLKEEPSKAYVKKLEQILDIGTKHVSIELPIIANDKDSPAMLENLTDTSPQNPDYELEHVESFRKEINTILKTFPEKERKVIEKLFLESKGGIGNTQDTIAKEMGLTDEGVRGIKERALEKLRKYPRLKEYL